MKRLASIVILLPLLMSPGACSSQPRSDAPQSYNLVVGQTRRDEVLSRYGEPDRIILELDEEVWIYDGSNPRGSYIDAALRMQEAMLIPSTTRPATTSATTNPADAARMKAMQEASMSLFRATLRNHNQAPTTLTFDRKTDRLRSQSGPLPPVSIDALIERARTR
jgi:hypothetical protein